MSNFRTLPKHINKFQFRMQTESIAESIIQPSIASQKQSLKPPKDSAQEQKRMVNGHAVSKIFHRFITLQKSYCISLVLQLVLTLVYYELDYDGKDSEADLLLICINVSVLPSILLAILSYVSYNQWKTLQLKQIETSSLKQLFLDILILLIQPIYFIQDYKISNYNLKQLHDIEFKLNYVFVIGAQLKLYLLLPCIMNMLKFKNPRSSRVCKIYNCSNSNLYLAKCYFKQNPIKMISSIFMICIVIFSFAYRVSERSKFEGEEQFDSYGNALWLVVITMTTVGFGDLYPKTEIGRIVGFFCTFCGVLTVSIMVLVVINTFQLDQNQSKALRILNKLEEKRQIKEISAQYLRVTLSRLWKNRKNRRLNNLEQIMPQSREQKVLRNSLRQKMRLSKFFESGIIDLGTQMSRQFQKIQYNIENLKDNSEEIINYLSNQYFIDIEEMKSDQKMPYPY